MQRLALSAALATLLAGCGSYLPSHGPSRFSIDRKASDAVKVGRRDVAFDYVLVDLSQKVLANLNYVGPESFYQSFGTGKGAPPLIKVGVGDAVLVTVFEASAGGLFSPGEVGTRPPGFVTLPVQNVDRKGNITVPYAGPIRAAGQTVEQIQRSIEQKLAQRAIEPQVVVSLPEQSSADVSVFGDAATSNIRTRVKAGGERVLDMIARVGIKNPGHEILVTLQRGQKRATVHLPVLVERPDENIYVHPGDVIYLNRSQQRYSMFGATGLTTQTTGINSYFAFEAPEHFLTEAVARAGGILDGRASARHVYLYRLEHRDSLVKMGVDLSHFPEDLKLVPTIYQANFRDPSVFFAANQFAIRHRDIIYVANADSVEFEKFLIHLRIVTSTVAGVATDVLTTRDSIRALGD